MRNYHTPLLPILHSQNSGERILCKFPLKKISAGTPIPTKTKTSPVKKTKQIHLNKTIPPPPRTYTQPSQIYQKTETISLNKLAFMYKFCLNFTGNLSKKIDTKNLKIFWKKNSFWGDSQGTVHKLRSLWTVPKNKCLINYGKVCY